LRKNGCDAQLELSLYRSVSFPGNKIERLAAHDDFFPFLVKILWIFENLMDIRDWMLKLDILSIPKNTLQKSD